MNGVLTPPPPPKYLYTHTICIEVRSHRQPNQSVGRVRIAIIATKHFGWQPTTTYCLVEVANAVLL